MTARFEQSTSVGSQALKAENLLAALELMQFGISLMRQNIARSLPGESKAHIERELDRWLLEQPISFVPRASSR